MIFVYFIMMNYINLKKEDIQKENIFYTSLEAGQVLLMNTQGKKRKRSIMLVIKFLFTRKICYHLIMKKIIQILMYSNSITLKNILVRILLCYGARTATRREIKTAQQNGKISTSRACEHKFKNFY